MKEINFVILQVTHYVGHPSSIKKTKGLINSIKKILKELLFQVLKGSDGKVPACNARD